METSQTACPALRLGLIRSFCGSWVARSGHHSIIQYSLLHRVLRELHTGDLDSTAHLPTVASVSARQPARNTTAHSTTRQFHHSPADRNPLGDNLTPSLSLFPTMTRSDFSLSPVSGDFLKPRNRSLRRRSHPHLHCPTR